MDSLPLCLALLRVGFAEPSKSPCLLVSSYLTVSPLPEAQAQSGGLLSVALSLVSQPVGVTDHPVLRSPDFPPALKTIRFKAGDCPLDSKPNPPPYRTLPGSKRVGSDSGKGFLNGQLTNI